MSYLSSLTNYLDDHNLLTENLEEKILEHHEKYHSNPSVKMPFGAHKGKTLKEIHAFKPSYIQWLVKQEYIKDKFQDIYDEAKKLLSE